MVGHGGSATEDVSIYDDDSSAGKTVVRIATVVADAASLGFAAASALLGAAAGAFASGRIADHIGRLAVMRIAAVLFLVSAIGSGFRREPDDAGSDP